MLDVFNGALTLNQSMMQQLRSAPDLMRRGFLVVLLVGLLVGAVEGIQTALNVATPARTVDLFVQQYDDTVQQLALGANTPEAREIVRVLDENREGIINLVRNLTTLPTVLPAPVGGMLQGLGQMVSRPLHYLFWVLLTVIFTHIAARQLGGQGTIQHMLGLGALAVAPHALDALGFIPVIGGAITLIGWFWGLAILIVATGIAHRLDSGRAALAVLLYPLIGFILAGLGCCALFVMLLALGSP
ncbi:MAG: YIP1 family protein [Oscillochloris sp.]|nr:YIP1 family protein [Oscillochloris sp.]